MAKAARKKLPLSGDRLVDTLFKIYIDALEKDVDAIYMKTWLRLPSNHKERAFGVWSPEENSIFLDKNAHKKHKEPLSRTIIHELMHQTKPNVRHRRIYQLEAALWPRLTDNQKRYLREYIPRHTVKKEP